MTVSKNTIMEEREEVMVSTTKGGDTTTRIGHFLKPSATSIDGPVFRLHPNSASVSELGIETKTYNNNNNSELIKKWPFKVAFNGWRYPKREWKSWVESMHSLHQSVWKQAGIHDALLNSVYTIHRDNPVIYGFAEKWCPETKTFVLPWGEVTITLEDMMILGGYSVIGDPVSVSVESQQQKLQLEKLIQARQQVTRSKAKKASQHGWLNKFMDSGCEIEHQAFLALWLSRFVFPSSSSSFGETISNNVFPIAILLARGTKIAFAPAVLATIYRDLSLLKDSILSANSNKLLGKDIHGRALIICVPLQILQIWVWERFPALSPNPDSEKQGQPRFARWDKLKKVSIENVKLTIETASGNFRWRPYAARAAIDQSLPHKCLYMVDSGLDEEFESLARCLRVSELVGLDNNNIEAYFPHRVGMQFGMDQDVPGHVPRADTSREVAWRNYTRPIEDENLYLPSCLFEPNITARYLEWWNKSMFGEENGNAGVEEKKNTSSSSKSSTRKMQQEYLSSKKVTIKADNDAVVPPGFPPKCSKAAEKANDDEDKIEIAQLIRTVQTGNGQSTEVAVENVVEGEHPTEGSEKKTRVGIATDRTNKEKNVVSIGSDDDDVDDDRGGNLEAIINRLEKVVAQIKDATAKYSVHRLGENLHKI